MHVRSAPGFWILTALTARATPRATLVVAAAAFLVSLGLALGLFGRLDGNTTPWSPLASRFVAGPVIAFAAALMVARQLGGRVHAPTALASLGLWTLHSLAALAALISISVGWDEKNRSSLTEDHTIWFGDSTLLWLALSGVLGLWALSVLARILFGMNESSIGSWAGAVGIAAICLFSIHLAGMTPPIAPLFTGTLLGISVVNLLRSATSHGGRPRPLEDTLPSTRRRR